MRQVRYPGYSRDIVSFGLVQRVAVHEGTVHLLMRMGHFPPDVQQVIAQQVRHVVGGLPGVRAVEVQLAPVGPRKGGASGASSPPAERPSFLAPDSPTVILPVASGKGGVGKSTVTVNLAVPSLGTASGSGSSAPTSTGSPSRPCWGSMDRRRWPARRSSPWSGPESG